jgi:hypothetical protein
MINKATVFVLLLPVLAMAQEKKPLVAYGGIGLNVAYVNTPNLNDELSAANVSSFSPLLIGYSFGFGIELNKFRLGAESFVTRNAFAGSSSNEASQALVKLILGMEVLEKEKFSLIPQIGIGSNSARRVVFLNQPATNISQSIITGNGNTLALRNEYTSVNIALKLKQNRSKGMYWVYEIGTDLSLVSSEWKSPSEKSSFQTPTSDKLNMFYVQFNIYLSTKKR